MLSMHTGRLPPQPETPLASPAYQLWHFSCARAAAAAQGVHIALPRLRVFAWLSFTLCYRGAASLGWNTSGANRASAALSGRLIVVGARRFAPWYELEDKVGKDDLEGRITRMAQTRARIRPPNARRTGEVRTLWRVASSAAGADFRLNGEPVVRIQRQRAHVSRCPEALRRRRPLARRSSTARVEQPPPLPERLASGRRGPLRSPAPLRRPRAARTSARRRAREPSLGRGPPWRPGPRGLRGGRVGARGGVAGRRRSFALENGARALERRKRRAWRGAAGGARGGRVDEERASGARRGRSMRRPHERRACARTGRRQRALALDPPPSGSVQYFFGMWEVCGRRACAQPARRRELWRAVPATLEEHPI